MRRSELDYILCIMLGMDRQTENVIGKQTEISDLNFTVDRPLQVEQNGELVAVECNPPSGRSDALPNRDGRPQPHRRQSRA